MTEKRSRGVDRFGKSKHHLLYYRTHWESHPTLLQLRSKEQLLVPLDPDAHDEVHRAVSHVPAISANMAAKTLKSFNGYRRTDDPIRAAENFQRAVENAMKDRRMDNIERLVGELAIYAIDLQKPFLQHPSSAEIIDLKYDGVSPAIYWQPDN